jgi:hypothetical protein
MGLPPGEIEYELCDENTGKVLAVLDLAWPDGLQPGLSHPVALLINAGKDIEKIVNQNGYLYFTAVDDLKKYIHTGGSGCIRGFAERQYRTFKEVALFLPFKSTNVSKTPISIFLSRGEQ